MTASSDTKLQRLDEQLIALATDASRLAREEPLESTAFQHERIPVSTMVAMHMQRLRPKIGDSAMKHMIARFDAIMVEVREALIAQDRSED
jgi:DNA-binding response OmpR family regulator